MKITTTLTKLDDHGFRLLCSDDAARQIKLDHGMHATSEVDILEYTGPEGRWSADDANPRRRYANTITLAFVRALPFVRAAIDAARVRFSELQSTYVDDQSLLEARREVYQYHRRQRLAELLEAIAKDPEDKSGMIGVAAARYGDLDAPEMLNNPFAQAARYRRGDV